MARALWYANGMLQQMGCQPGAAKRRVFCFRGCTAGMSRLAELEQDQEGSRTTIRHARLLYAMISEALVEALEALRAQKSDRTDAKERLELLRLHQKALQTVIDLEVGLEKRGSEGGGRVAVELDLDAARAEIHRRISGIRAARGD